MPVSLTSNIGALTAGTVLSITNGGYADGTGQPNGVRMGQTKRDFMVQIFKETYGLEGKQFTTSQWIEATYDNNGNEIPYSVVTQLSAETQLRLDAKINGAFMLGQKATNTNMTQTTDEGATNPVRFTQGLYPTIAENGQTVNIPSGSFDVEDLDDIGLYMRSQGVTRNLAYMPMGANRHNEVENEVKDYIQGNGTDLLKDAGKMIMGADPDDMMLHIGFSAIKKGNYTYMFKIIDELSDPEGLGRSGYDLNQYAFVLPIEDIRDPKRGVLNKNIATRYIKKGSYSRKFEMWSEGAAGGDTENYTGDVDKRKYYMRTHLGFQILGANQMQVIVP
jgi:hypothetical protein